MSPPRTGLARPIVAMTARPRFARGRLSPRSLISILLEAGSIRSGLEHEFPIRSRSTHTCEALSTDFRLARDRLGQLL